MNWQEEQKKVATGVTGGQEPLAWRETYGKIIKALAGIVNVHTPDKLFDLYAIPREPVMALVQDIKAALDKYKPPQLKREWVGLTPMEVIEIELAHGNYPRVFAAVIEAKLKDKNEAH
jgi:hypothetical protein